MITDEEQIRFSRAFGPLELPPSIGGGKNPRDGRIAPQLYDVSNLDREGNVYAVGGPRLPGQCDLPHRQFLQCPANQMVAALGPG